MMDIPLNLNITVDGCWLHYGVHGYMGIQFAQGHVTLDIDITVECMGIQIVLGHVTLLVTSQGGAWIYRLHKDLPCGYWHHCAVYGCTDCIRKCHLVNVEWMGIQIVQGHVTLLVTSQRVHGYTDCTRICHLDIDITGIYGYTDCTRTCHLVSDITGWCMVIQIAQGHVTWILTSVCSVWVYRLHKDMSPGYCHHCGLHGYTDCIRTWQLDIDITVECMSTDCTRTCHLDIDITMECIDTDCTRTCHLDICITVNAWLYRLH